MVVSVFLFKEAEENYKQALISEALQPFFIPVLSEHFDLKALESLLATDPTGKYWGIISTSKRASLAFKTSFQNLSAQLSNHNNIFLSKWKRLTIFCVGKSTAKPFTEIGCDVKGDNEAINASTLSEYIIKFLQEMTLEERNKVIDKKLIFLIGDKTRPDLQDTLTLNNIFLETFQVYKTFPHPEIKTAITNIINDTSCDSWLVFFSPSGVDVALKELKESSFFQKSRVAAIGKTTQSHLLYNGIKVDAVPVTPTANDLVKAIQSASS